MAAARLLRGRAAHNVHPADDDMEGCARAARERFDILPGDMGMNGLPEDGRQTLLAGDQMPRAKPIEAA